MVKTKRHQHPPQTSSLTRISDNNTLPSTVRGIDLCLQLRTVFDMSVRRPTNNSNDPNNQQDESSPIGYRLDPTDWDAYRFQMHQLLDECCSRMKSYRELPWQPPPSDMHQGLCMQMGVDDLPGGDGGGGGNENRNSSAGRPLDAVVDELVNDIMPYATGNTHPKFMGWVHGAGLPSSTVRVRQDLSIGPP